MVINKILDTDLIEDETHIDSEFVLDARHTATKEIVIRGHKVPINRYLHENLLFIKKGIENNFDGVMLFDGMEGSGKSELANECALVIDDTFNEDDIFYTVEQFDIWLENAAPGKSGVWDEFALAGLGADALTSLQTLLIKKFVMIRKKRLFIALVIPYFFMLRRYFATSRTRALIHVYTKGMTRGYFKFYNYQKKLRLYVTGYKYMDYKIGGVHPDFTGTFKAWSHKYINDDIVQEKKDEAIENLGDARFSMTKARIKLLKDIVEEVLEGKNPYDQRVDKNRCQNFASLKRDLAKMDK